MSEGSEVAPMDATAQPTERLRIGDAERDQMSTALQEHFTLGRLTRDELDERLTTAMTARTIAELRPLTLDLPAPRGLPVPASAPGTPPGAPGPSGGPAGRRRRPGHAGPPPAGPPVGVLIGVLIAATIVLAGPGAGVVSGLRPPPLVLLLILGAIVFHSRRRWRRRRPVR